MRLRNVVGVAQLIITKHKEMLTNWLRILIEGALRNRFSTVMKDWKCWHMIRSREGSAVINKRAGKKEIYSGMAVRENSLIFHTKRLYISRETTHRSSVISDTGFWKSMHTLTICAGNLWKLPSALDWKHFFIMKILLNTTEEQALNNLDCKLSQTNCRWYKKNK